MLLLARPLKIVQKFIYNTVPDISDFNTQKEASEAVKNLPLNYTDNPKPSAYNYFQDGKTLHAVYNTLYCSMAFLSDHEWAVLHNTQTGDETVLKKLFAAGFMVPKETDEFAQLQKYRMTYYRFIAKESSLSLIIPTTTKCNARCAYCFQDNAGRADILPGVEEDIKKFVNKNIGQDKKLTITWFGGEPLLNTGLIDRLSNYFLQQGYEFTSDIPTNGSLLTEAILKENFPKWHIKGMQITLDGTAENYARIKNYVAPELGKLERILENIDLADKYKIRTHIRLNVNKDNIDDLLVLAKQLNERYASSEYVTWYSAHLQGTAADFHSDEEFLEMVERFSPLQAKSPWKISNVRKPPKINFCMAERPGSYCIEPNGDLKICFESITNNLNDIGNIRDFDPQTDQRREPSSLHSQCEKCVWLPLCGGGCMYRRSKGLWGCSLDKFRTMHYLKKLTE